MPLLLCSLDSSSCFAIQSCPSICNQHLLDICNIQLLQSVFLAVWLRDLVQTLKSTAESEGVVWSGHNLIPGICGSSAQVIGFPEIPSKPPPQPAPSLRINMQQQSAFTSYSYGTGSPAGPMHPALAKDVPQRTPPSRPAPPAPRSPSSQVWCCAAVLQEWFGGRLGLSEAFLTRWCWWDVVISGPSCFVVELTVTALDA